MILELVRHYHQAQFERQYPLISGFVRCLPNCLTKPSIAIEFNIHLVCVIFYYKPLSGGNGGFFNTTISCPRSK